MTCCLKCFFVVLLFFSYWNINQLAKGSLLFAPCYFNLKLLLWWYCLKCLFVVLIFEISINWQRDCYIVCSLLGFDDLQCCCGGIWSVDLFDYTLHMTTLSCVLWIQMLSIGKCNKIYFVIFFNKKMTKKITKNFDKKIYFQHSSTKNT